MLFSILIANYNNSDFIGTALESVLAQTYTHWEVIIVDDGSTDSFREKIKPYLSEMRIKVYYNIKNYGCGFTKRRCAENATGELMAFLDPDDALHPDAMAILATAHMHHPECSLIHSTHYICADDLRVLRVADYPRALSYQIPYLLLNDGRIHHFAVFKKECYVKTEGIEAANKKAVDQDLYYKLEETGAILFIDQPLYYYRIHSGSISNNGMEAETTIWHFSIVAKACKRRMKAIDQNSKEGSLKRKYRVHYYKTKIFLHFRKKEWFFFIGNLIQYPFIGGWPNLVQYFRKLPREGMSLIRKSFVDTYSIKGKAG
ncbi:MAG: glycosyltransferase family 2 protein [Chitinophagaceae bacterium]